MVTLHMGSNTWIVLNSDRVVSELIAKRGKITNERPHMPIASELVSNGKRTVIRQEEEWKEGRRVMHQLLSGSNLKVYAGMQELESVDMLRRYLREPNLWFAHNFRYATSVLYRIVMGYPLNKTRAELNDYQRVTIEFVTTINRSYVDFFPSLSKLPYSLQPWRNFWAQMGSFHRRVFQEWWRPVEAAVTNGSAPPSFVRDVLLHPDVRFSGDDEEAMYLATSVMAAGGDNTRMTINVFIMAMVTNPECQARAREEVDRVCTDGTSLRLPRMSDLQSMPYVAAMIKEVLRWRPTVPVVPPHQLTEDLEFDGHFIPAGTVFLINSIGLSSEFDNAHKFQPERWIDSTGSDKIPNFWGFGGGRRICVGWKVAEQALFIAFARLLYCFELTPVRSSLLFIPHLLNDELLTCETSRTGLLTTKNSTTKPSMSRFLSRPPFAVPDTRRLSRRRQPSMKLHSLRSGLNERFSTGAQQCTTREIWQTDKVEDLKV